MTTAMDNTAPGRSHFDFIFWVSKLLELLLSGLLPEDVGGGNGILPRVILGWETFWPSE